MTHRFTTAHWGTYQIKDQTLVPYAQDPAPSTIGAGWLDAMQNTDTRIARPSIRKDWLENRSTERTGDSVYTQVPWDEALDIVSEELSRVSSAYGNASIFAGSYGWASSGRFHHAQSQTKRFLSTIGGYTSSRNTYSHAAAEVLWPHVLGLSNAQMQNATTSLETLVGQCDLLVAFGGISDRTAQISSGGSGCHPLSETLSSIASHGTEIVNISPQRSDIANALNADWVSIRPGTDTALILALAYELFSKGLANRSFLATYTHGADIFEAYVMGSDEGEPKTPEWAAHITGLEPDKIRTLAHKMAKGRTMISMAWALQRADHGEQPIWAGLALAAILGQIGQPGTGFTFGYGCETYVGFTPKAYAWPAFEKFQNTVNDFIPVAHITELLNTPGSRFQYDGETFTLPDTRLVWWAGGNPFHHHQDLIKLQEAWQKPETVIVLDHSWTATARRADIVLPTTSPLERSDLMLAKRDPHLIYMSPAMPHYAEARDDYDILSDLSQRMGTRDMFTQGRSSEDWLAALWKDAQKVAASEGCDIGDFQSIKETGMIRLPEPEKQPVLLDDFVADPDIHPLNTPSGKIELSSDVLGGMSMPKCGAYPQWRAPFEWLGDAEPDQLHLISGQPNTRLHGQCDSGSVSKASKIKEREVCVLHPEAASARNLRTGDVVLIRNDRGACLAAVEISDAVRPDCISLATGAWLDLQWIDGMLICVHGNPNVLTKDESSSELSHGNCAHTCLVRVEKWTRPLPDIKVHSPPRFET